jgi:peptide/nickel transport system substrate-binding protein
MTESFRIIGTKLGRRGVLLGTAAAALGGVLPGTRTFAQETPKRGGKLVMARNADVVSFEPVVPSDNMSIWAKLLVFQMLARTTPDGNSVEPDLAEKWEISADKRTYTFHLRQNAMFSDGSPVTSDDVEFSYQRVSDKDSPWAAMYPKMTMTKPDAKTIVFDLQEDYAPFLAAASLHGACIVPKAYFNKVGIKQFGEQPIGSGPFVMTEWKKGDSSTFDRNPHFWDPSRPYLDTVVLSIIADDNVRMLKVQSGEIDIASFVPFSQIDRLKHAPGIATQVSPYDRVDWFQFNTKKPQFQDAKVRQALNYAVNKEAIVKSVLFGYGEVPTSFLPKMFLTDLTQKPYAYDMAKAKQLMAESSMPDGFAATLKTVSGDAVGNQVAQIVQQMVLPLKIKLTIEQVESDTQYSQVQNGDYEMAWGYMTSDILDPSELVSYAAQSDGGSSAVWTFYKSDEVDSLAHKGLAELDAAKRADIYTKLQQIVFADAPYLWLYWTPAVSALRDNVKGFRVLPTGNYWLENVWKS